MFLGTGSLDFPGFCQGASNHYEVVHDNSIFLKAFFAEKLGKWSKNRFLEFKEKFGYQFSLNLFYNEYVYYLLCSCTNPMFGKNFVPEM